MLKNIVMAFFLTTGIVFAMIDSPDFTWFIASKIIAVFFFVLSYILAGGERLVETTGGKKLKTFLESVLDIVVEFCCLVVVGGAMFVGVLLYAVILTPIAIGFVLWLIVEKAYKKIFC